MTEQMIHSIIDDIAHDAKIIISEHLHPERGGVNEMIEAFKQSAKDCDEAGEKMARVFRDLEDDVRTYFDKYCADYAEGGSEYRIGEEVYFISGGCAVKDRIKDVKLQTESGKWLSVNEAFHSMDELVEHLKENVHG